jgi:hypothetical protein
MDSVEHGPIEIHLLQVEEVAAFSDEPTIAR